MTLTITIGGQGYEFSGPYTQTGSLASKSGTYVVTTKKKSGDHKILDVGESGDVKKRVENHDRSDCWVKEEKDGLFYSGYYCDEPRNKTCRQHTEHIRPALRKEISTEIVVPRDACSHEVGVRRVG